jgi:hypothetical protein
MNTKVTIGIPSNMWSGRGMRNKMAQCLFDLVTQSKHDIKVIIANEGYTIAENRNFLAVQAVKNNSEYLLMIDDDMTFEPTLLDDLIANNKDIVGVAYHPRTETGQIIKYMDEVTSVAIENSQDPKYKDTFECHATGTGIILIKSKVFHKIPRPWFAFEYHPTGQCKLGEDWYFCREAKKVGYKIYTDPKPKIGHIGYKIY